MIDIGSLIYTRLGPRRDPQNIHWTPYRSRLPVSTCDCSRPRNIAALISAPAPACTCLSASFCQSSGASPPCGSEPFPASSSCPCTPPRPALVGIPCRRRRNLTLPSLFFSIHHSPQQPTLPRACRPAQACSLCCRAIRLAALPTPNWSLGQGRLFSSSPFPPARRLSLVARHSSLVVRRLVGSERKQKHPPQPDDDLTPSLLPRPSHPTTAPFLLDILWCGFLLRRSPTAQILLDGTFYLAAGPCYGLIS